MVMIDDEVEVSKTPHYVGYCQQILEYMMKDDDMMEVRLIEMIFMIQ